MRHQVNYSLYLVTDSTEAILGSRDLVEVVEQALLGGVTIVQYRDKTSDTGILISTAKKLHEKCKQHNIPLLINDRVDVALAVGCEGVHLGQDDMDISEARRILGEDKIIGATVSSIEEARIAVERGADYLGIGTLYATNTKKNTKDIIGVNGIRKILRFLDTKDAATKEVKSVCIGGVNASNLQRIIHQLSAPTPNNLNPKTIDGVAIVSAIIGASNPKEASEHLSHLLATPPPFKASSSEPHFWLEKDDDEISHLLSEAIKATKAVREKSPLSHNMTNLVVQNFAANVALSIGASPIMANYGDEASDLSKLGGALVVNMGTVTPEGLENYKKAIAAYNAAGGPIVLDPVGAGATSVRRNALATLMSTSYFDLIKGNEREIMQVARASGFTLDDSSQQRGVDSGSALFALPQRAYIVQRIAARERNVVLMTGATDIISDGTRTYSISNGHAYLGMITGSGCTLGTTLSAYLAANPQDKLYAAVAGILHYELAAEVAAGREDVKGPGTFVPAFIDELYHCSKDVVEGKLDWRGAAKVNCIKDVPDAGLLKEL
ncbi:thiamine biosynthetic bifunctional enzyme [Neocucurbitaria cava]|uniref:Thiamine biosynthetic bifunctional enzyme n=1 Tax=Neocucurbitaria cava TaxID=798079 RepID=A0A9W8XZB4_9PLEO|nr:thiamine biosynthetic bifunctional enzyme [Neocucurbitaria cava]